MSRGLGDDRIRIGEGRAHSLRESSVSRIHTGGRGLRRTSSEWSCVPAYPPLTNGPSVILGGGVARAVARVMVDIRLPERLVRSATMTLAACVLVWRSRRSVPGTPSCV